MKPQKFGPLPVLGLTLAAGLAGFILRMLMLSLGYDQLGVQISGHWTYISLWALSLVTLAGLAFLSTGMGNRRSAAENLPASLPAAIGSGIAGGLLFVQCLIELLGQSEPLDIFDLVVRVLGLVAGGLIVFGGYLRRTGRASAPAGMAITLFFALRLVSQFRGWSSDPMLGDYGFSLLACICTMLAAYYLAGFPLNEGRRRLCIFFSMAAVFFSCICLADPEGWIMSLSVILWLLTGGCTLSRPRPPRRRPGNLPAEENHD